LSGGIDAYNARQVARRADVSLSALIDEFARNRAATIAAVEMIDEPLLAVSIRSAGGIEGSLADVLRWAAVDHVLGHVRDLERTCISLDTLTTWLSQIPARRLICILDCCFSGGFGAKVLVVDAIPRSFASTGHLLDQMAGDGRLILTASSAIEPAWENPRFGHGFLTQYLLEALQGAEEVRDSGKISVYRLLDYVTKRVIAAADQIGRPQHPAIRGQLDGELTWPIFMPGQHYRNAFPERMTAPATTDILSLSAYGSPPALLAAWGAAIPSFNTLQLAAINDFSLHYS